MIIKKIANSLLSLLIAGLIVSPNVNVLAEENTQENNLQIVYSEEVNLSDLSYDEEITVYNQNNIKITITLNSPEIQTRSSGDSGWTGGSIPSGVSTLTIQCSHELGNMSYKMDVRGSDCSILRAYNLTYNVGIWTVNNTSLAVYNQYATNSQPAYATATINATLVEYGIVVASFGGYLTGELNTNGNVRVTYSF